MSDKSAIEWTDATWNPVTGCTKVSPGCDHCYAERFAERWRGIPGHPFERGFDVVLRPERLGEPLRWNKPRMENDFEARQERERTTIQAFLAYFKRRYRNATIDLLPRAGTMTRILIRLPGPIPGSEARTLDFGITDTRMATITAHGFLTEDSVERYLLAEHEFFETLESGNPAVLKG